MKKLLILSVIFVSFTTFKPIYGIATTYSDKFIGKKTASGEIFSQKKLTAASNLFPLGTKVRVINLKNNKEVILKINDKSASWTVRRGRVIDLTKKAASLIGANGYTKVKVERV